MGAIEHSSSVKGTLHCLLYLSLLPTFPESKVQVLYTLPHCEKTNNTTNNSEAMHTFNNTMQHLQNMVLCCKAFQILKIPWHFCSPLICCSNFSFYTWSSALALHMFRATPGTYLYAASTHLQWFFLSLKATFSSIPSHQFIPKQTSSHHLDSEPLPDTKTCTCLSPDLNPFKPDGRLAVFKDNSSCILYTLPPFHFDNFDYQN